MQEAFTFLKSIDTELYRYIEQYGLVMYIVLFFIVYAKTAFVVLTFLPGDSTVFASGTIAATGHLNVWVLFLIFFLATVIGDAQNYTIGVMIRRAKATSGRFSPLKYIPEKTITKATNFLESYGKIAITFSRFVPLMRTTVPLVSGFTSYKFRDFFINNCIGALIWTVVWLFTGLALGNIPVVADNLFISLILISFTGLIPAIIAFIVEYIKKYAKKTRQPQ
ncbi:DedA family protein [Lysinibacillus sp. NPDC097287]|uniref:DedA family protein n=1 Tax=Lysinibacillus sp. NPDC097287 TaxID=3364144 RepID=UPI0037F16942